MFTLEKTVTVTKQDFIKALRSDNYDQLQDGRMHDSEGRSCALMVWYLLNDDIAMTEPVGGKKIHSMPIDLANRISELNDIGYTFAEIADFLENDNCDSF